MSRFDEKKRASGKSKSSHGDFGKSALKSAESYVARGASASSPRDESRSAFARAFRALLEWGEARSLICPEADFPFLGRSPDAHGNEHECWFDEPSNRWFKATFANRFGLAWGRDGTATAEEYLIRLTLQNRYFGDDIRLEALVNCNEHLRILISQPHISGGPATAKEIRDWFLSLGFYGVESGDRIAWYRIKENLLVSDAHEGNVIKTRDGVLVPIDLNIVQPSGELLEWAKNAARILP
jgi:hypothetical protein